MIYVKSIILKPTHNVKWVEIDKTSTYARFWGWLLFAAATTTVPLKMSVCDGGRPLQQRAITLKNKCVCSFLRVEGGRVMVAAAKSNHPQKQAYMLIFEGDWWWCVCSEWVWGVTKCHPITYG